MRPEVDLVLSFFLAGWSAVDDSSAGRFLDLDDPEVESETVVDVVRELGFFAAHRKGLGGRAWFKIGSTSVPNISHVQTRGNMLTVDNQSRHSRSVTKGIIVRVDFEDPEGVY